MYKEMTKVAASDSKKLSCGTSMPKNSMCYFVIISAIVHKVCINCIKLSKCLLHQSLLSVACYGIVSPPTSGVWYCRKCESQERAARVVCICGYMCV